MKTKENSIDRAIRLIEYDGEDRIISASELLEEMRARPKPAVELKSELPTLDALTGGFSAGQLITISGLTGNGKTTLAQTLTWSAIAQDILPLWFSYEVDAEDFLKNFKKDSLTLLYLPRKLTGKTTGWLEERILEAQLKHGTQVVFIDHLHYLIDLARTQNISFDIGFTVRGLKRLAVEHNVIIFLIAHTTKTKPDTELGLGDVRDSSFIEQESDCVLYVWRSKTEGVSVAKVAKNRKRGIIDKKINLVFRNGRYYEEVSVS